MSEEAGIEEAKSPSIFLWHAEGEVSMILKFPHVMEYEEELCAGSKLSPIAAMEVAESLLKLAREAMIWNAEHQQEIT